MDLVTVVVLVIVSGAARPKRGEVEEEIARVLWMVVVKASADDRSVMRRKLRSDDMFDVF